MIEFIIAGIWSVIMYALGFVIGYHFGWMRYH